MLERLFLTMSAMVLAAIAAAVPAVLLALAYRAWRFPELPLDKEDLSADMEVAVVVLIVFIVSAVLLARFIADRLLAWHSRPPVECERTEQ